MTSEATATLVVSLFLLIANAFFVMAEYGLVGARRLRIEALARQGSPPAKALLHAIQHLSTYVAAIQVSITLAGIAIGAITEPFLTRQIEPHLAFLPLSVVKLISILVTAYPLVVFGELVPKYIALQQPEQVALATILPLRAVNLLLTPIVVLTRRTGELILRLLRIDVSAAEQGLTREELALLVRTSRDEGQVETEHANLISRALKLDTLHASDVMVHRLDMKWVKDGLDRDGLGEALRTLAHSRLPVCGTDIDDVVGVVYLQDIVRQWNDEGFSLKTVMRPAEFVPESLSLDRVVQRMREARTQILIVRDEYGGTSGLLTLEDVVEEIFGELEDSLESERPPIERASPTRVTARATVRYDELLAFLERDPEHQEAFTTETLAEIVVDSLGRVPRAGDRVEVPIGVLVVENMTRRRIVRVALLESRKRLEKS